MDGLTKIHPSMIDGDFAELIDATPAVPGAPTISFPAWLAAQPLNAVVLGAKGGDGVDDAPAIRRAVNAAGAAGGGIVYVPPGAYSLGSTVTVPSGVSLIGAGRGATKFTAMSDFGSILLLDGASNVSVTGIGFWGTWYATPSDGNYGGIYIANGCQKVLVQDCEFRDFRGNGCDLNVGNSFVTVRRNYFENTRVGVSVFKGNSSCRAVDNDLRQVREIGINVDDATSTDTEGTAVANNRILVSRNHLYEVGTAPGSVGIACQGSAYVTITANHIHRSGRAAGVSTVAIMVNGGQAEYHPSLYVDVRGNHIAEGTAEAIVVKASRGVSVTNNQINDNWQWPSALVGVLPEILIAPGTSTVTTGILIDGNQIAHNGTPTGRANYAVSSSSSDNTDIQIGTNHLRGFSVDQHYGGYNLQLLFQGHQSLSTLPAVAHRGRLVHNQTDDKFYGGTASGWVVVGSQS